MNAVVYKYHTPTKYDIHPYGTRWYVTINDNVINQYIQTSKDESLPYWQILGVFLEVALQEQLKDDSFIQQLLSQYEQFCSK